MAKPVTPYLVAAMTVVSDGTYSYKASIFVSISMIGCERYDASKRCGNISRYVVVLTFRIYNVMTFCGFEKKNKKRPKNPSHKYGGNRFLNVF